MIEIRSAEDIKIMKNEVIRSASIVARKILSENKEGLELFKEFKFTQYGLDPLDSERDLNIIEQINQTFTYLVTFEATLFLLEKHIEAAPFFLNIGARRGYDIISYDNNVVAETFAAVDPRNNNKLNKDIKRVNNSEAKYKYVFYNSPFGNQEIREIEGVVIVPVGIFL